MLLISLYPWMLSLTPPSLHSWHSICSGGVSASGGALSLFRLDVCMCQQGGEFWEKWSNKGRLVWFLKNLLCTGLWECIILGELHLWEEKNFAWGVSALVLAPGFPHFPSTSCMTASSVTSVIEELCFGFWSIASSCCPCLRESICAWVSDYSWLSELFCHLIEPLPLS